MMGPAMSKIISANRLSDGLVVYFAAEGTWTLDIAGAKSFATEAELDAGLKFAKSDEKRNLVVDPFAVAVEAAGAKAVAPLSLRNAIRAKGPTIAYLPQPEQSLRS
jgi:hypothetical protein